MRSNAKVTEAKKSFIFQFAQRLKISHHLLEMCFSLGMKWIIFRGLIQLQNTHFSLDARNLMKSTKEYIDLH